MRDDVDIDEEPVGHVLSRGWIGDLIFGFSLPSVAIPGRPLYRVELHGFGIESPVEGKEEPIIGFYVVYILAASSIRDAEARAVERIREYWETFYAENSGQLQVEIEETGEYDGWFARRSRSAFAFYDSDT